MNKLLRRLRYLRLGHQMDADLAEEMKFHQTMAEGDLSSSGMTAEEAALAARRTMGAITQMREEARGVWVWPWMESVWQDFVYAKRNFRRQPAFTLVAVLALACGIGLNTSLFTVFNAVALRPWAVSEPGRMVKVLGVIRNPLRGFDSADGFAPAEYRYLAQHSKTMAGMFQTRGEGSLHSDTGKTRAEQVSNNYFRVLGVSMERGRGFLAEEDNIDNPAAVAVLSYDTWRNRFGGDPGVIGRRLRLEDVPFTVVGVAPANFGGTSPERTDVWLPFASMVLFHPHDPWARDFLHKANHCCADVAGRLARGVTREQARAELTVLSADFHRDMEDKSGGIVLTGTAILQGSSKKAGEIFAAFGLMFAGVLLVLLLACANVGNLLLARAAARRREIGVRLSLGAGRWRLVRQLLTESLSLAGMAAVLGVALAYFLPGPLFRNAVGEVSFNLQPDATVLAFTLAIAVLTSVAFGLAPALQATKGNFTDALKQRIGVSKGRHALRGLLLAIQVAVSVILLVGAGLMIRGIQRARSLDPGFTVEGIASVELDFPASAYPAARVSAFYQDLQQRLGGLPGVQTIGLTELEPLGGTRSFTAFRLPQDDEAHMNPIMINSVSAGYFEILHIGVVAGRNFNPTDDGRNVILVNQAMADRYFPGENPVGKTILTGGPKEPPLEIAGVVKNAHTTGLDDVQPVMYTSVSFASAPRLLLPDSPAIRAAVPALAKNLDPHVETHLTPLSVNLDKWLSTSRIGAAIAGLLGLLALSLAAIGVSGVFAYAVQQRRQEIGIRMALGAQSAQVIGVMIRPAGRALAIGLALGLAGAIAGSALLRQYLYGLSRLDPMTYAAVVATMAIAGIAASYLPAHRAVRVDPVDALRQD